VELYYRGCKRPVRINGNDWPGEADSSLACCSAYNEDDRRLRPDRLSASYYGLVSAGYKWWKVTTKSFVALWSRWEPLLMGTITEIWLWSVISTTGIYQECAFIGVIPNAPAATFFPARIARPLRSGQRSKCHRIGRILRRASDVWTERDGSSPFAPDVVECLRLRSPSRTMHYARTHRVDRESL